MAGGLDWARLRKTYEEDGMVKLPGLLSPEALAHCRRCYDWSLENPSMMGAQFYREQGGGFYNDASGTKASLPVYKELLETTASAIGDACLGLWADSENVWFQDHEIFRKFGGTGRGTPFHQDTSYYPWCGRHMAVFWIPFEAVPKKYSLELCRGSHLGPLYNATKVFALGAGPELFPNSSPILPTDDDTTGLYSEEQLAAVGVRMEPIPDVLSNTESWDVIAYDVVPGDVIVFHPHALHGGGPVDASFPDRHTLAMRFFGDQCLYRTLPEVSEGKRYKGLRDGQHFGESWNGNWVRLRGNGLRHDKATDAAQAGPAVLARL